MKYKVHEGAYVLWPDGSTRADAGEVFDGFNTNGTRESIAFACAILASHRDHIYPTEEEVTVTDTPEVIKAALASQAGSFEAVMTSAKPKATRKKKASKKSKAKPVADPDEEC